MHFRPAGNLFITRFFQNVVERYNRVHPHPVTMTLPVPGPPSCTDSSAESIVFDAAGNFYVGHADGCSDVHKYDPAGNFLAEYDVPRESRGSDWIDLACDQCTLFYTSEGRKILRYDVCKDKPLPQFATLPAVATGRAFALRILPPGDGSGGVLVVDSENIKRTDGSGNVVQVYSIGFGGWYSLDLDPNGTSFWAGNLSTNNSSNSPTVYKFNIATGAIEVGPIYVFGDMGGVCVAPTFEIPCPVQASKDFRFTDVDFAACQLGTFLPTSGGNYLARVVLRPTDGRVLNTNPGQLYGVTTIQGLGGAQIDQLAFTDNFGIQFDVNPAKTTGGVNIIVVGPGPICTDITNTPGVTTSIDNAGNSVTTSIDLVTATGSPLMANEQLMVYVKFEPAPNFKGATGQTFPQTFSNSVSVSGSTIATTSASATISLSP